MESVTYGESHGYSGYSSSSESRESSESRGYSGYSSSSESRESSESRGYEDIVGYGNPSESAYYGESHEFYQPNSGSSTEIRIEDQPTKSSYSKEEQSGYNTLEDVDKLIEKLENDLPSRQSKNVQYNKAISRRKQQIKELKKLRDEAQAQIKEREMISDLEKESDKIDEEINKVKQFLKIYNSEPEEDLPF